MKKIALLIILIAQLGLYACSSNPTANLGVNAERVAASHFDRDGIQLTYTLDGKLVGFQSTAYVPIWGDSPKALDEAQQRAEKIAKVQLNHFLDKKTVSSPLSISIIAINLEHAREQKSNASSNSYSLVASDREVLLDKNGKDANADSESSEARDDASSLADLLDKKTDWRDVSNGMVLLSATPLNNGQTLQLIYRWSAR